MTTQASTNESITQLTPPERIAEVEPAAAKQMVSLGDQQCQAVDDQVERFIAQLLGEDIQSDAFKAKLDSAFRLGREEISIAAGLMSSHFMQQRMIGVENSPAFVAIGEMRKHLDDLNPGKQGDLLAPNKILGFIPFGNRLKAYFRRFQSAGVQMQTALQQVYSARDDMQKDAIGIDAARARLWEAMQKLTGAIRFAEQLDQRLAEKVSALKATDADRAKALEQEVQYYARQNLQDMLTQQAVCVNGYLALDMLKKTSREMIVGCDRVATTGMSALSVAQVVARATGNQIEVMNMLSGVNSAIENLIAESGKQLNNHVERVAQFGSNPLLGIEKMKEMFDLTFKAMDTLDTFRTKAVEVMGQNNTAIQEQLKRADSYLDKVRQDKLAVLSDPVLAGPVQL
ncbi:MAG: toxic anion resistance protein [Burkholderiaceae bacterium]|nr:toxic anion resistance protein [Burkholderiaceae bacterium]MCF8184176.1 toxic anion resistance protein [Polynucleobacter sp.]